LIPAVVVINIPFGYWRQGARRFSLPWFLAIHAPVPLVAALRISSGLGWHFTTLLVLAAAYFTGQYIGGVLRRRLRSPTEISGESKDEAS
jgi:hypothetical protein